MKITHVIAALVYLPLTSYNAFAEIFQCVDSRGKISYSDSPCASDQDLVKKIDLPEENLITWKSDTECRGSSQTSVYHADFEDKLGWQPLVVDDLVAPEEARGAVIELIQSVKGTGSFIVYWDDVVLSVK